MNNSGLYNLPYSVEEIYGFYSSGKYQNTRRVYQQMYRIYSGMDRLLVRPEKIVVEDSNSGYEFFKSVADENGMECESAGGKTKLYSVLKEKQGEICVIADGAAIGDEKGK